MRRLAAALPLVAVPVVALIVGVATTLRPGPARDTLEVVVPLGPAAVRRLIVESGGRRVELTRSPHGWSPAGGTPVESASLLFAIEERLLPLRAYRRVPADPSDPQFGLGRPAIMMSVEDERGDRHQVALGAPSFSGGGFYARPLGAGSDRLYLVARHLMNDLRSLVLGRPIRAEDPVGEKLARAEADEPQDQPAPWLQQVLEAGGRLPPGLE